MRRPLYQEALEATRGAEGNAGLWYDKFCDAWTPAWDGLQPPQGQNQGGKALWIKSMTGKPVGEAQLLEGAATRRMQLSNSRKGAVQVLHTEGPFVTGLGRSHPVENGFGWHQNYGVPYLPGSSVKGMVRSWAATWLGEDSQEIDRIFGPRRTGEEDSAAVGTVIFADALPPCPVQLKSEVMTPHYSEWYQGGGVPGDWLSPNPISFLAVDSGQSFHFMVLPVNPENPQHVEDCRKATDWLCDALQNIGAGAKTASGYGRFVQDASAQQHLENRAEALLFPNRQKVREVEALQGWGHLKDTVLEDEAKSNWRSIPEVALAVQAKAEDIRSSKPDKWDEERDRKVSEWLQGAGLQWRSLAEQGSEEEGEGLSPEEQEAVESIQALGDWGQWLNTGLKMETLPRAALVTLQEKFKSWNCDNKKASPAKRDAYKQLKSLLKK